MTTGLTATGVLIPSGGVRLVGDLVAVPGADGTVVFVHGSGSGRLSPRDRHVAARLREGGPSTVLVDLLDAAEAALATAAPHPERVDAVVCPGGRPDPASELLAEVRASTPLAVGDTGTDVLEIDRRALAQLGGPCRLHVAPGATHLIPGPGALDTVAAVARDWFLAHPGARAIPTKEA